MGIWEGVRGALLATTPLPGLYVLGGALNEATGGDTKQWDLNTALSANDNRVSLATRVIGFPALAYGSSLQEFQRQAQEQWPPFGDLLKKLLIGVAVVGGVVFVAVPIASARASRPSA